MSRTFSLAAAAALIGGMVSVGSADAADWSLPVTVFNDDGTTEQMNYEPLDVSQITQKWDLCVIFPHVKDPYYLAYTHGSVTEAERIGASLQILAAGGYTELAKQISLVEDCVARLAFPSSISASA